MTPLLLAASLGISVIFKLPAECSVNVYKACYVTSRPKMVYISPKYTGRYKTYLITHEIGHAVGYGEEKDADAYAGVMMKRYKW